MKMQTSKYLLGTASVLALLASAAPQPANAAASSATRALYFGGSTLASEAFRQIFDCYTGGTVGFGTTRSDGYTFTTAFPAPGALPNTCVSPTQAASVNGLYAGVGSGNGTRGFIANNPQQWYGGTAVTGQTGALPAASPPTIDLANPQGTVFGSYPYPRVDVGMSDSPLAIATTATTLTTASFTFTPAVGWDTTTGTTTFTAGASAPATYNPSVYGAPIQLPAFEVNVAIPVNTQGLTVNSGAAQGTINASGAPWTQANQGAAIQLTTAQMCAIFSGVVSDWNSTASIASLTNAGVLTTTAFHDANKNSSGTSTQYSTTSKPITVVFRSDGSGTSFILTNYLKAVCPQLDNGTNGYAAIFGASNLPSTSFSNLISNIAKPAVTGTWVGATGSGGVASGVSDTTGAKEGRIGYVSSDFTRPYTTVVAGVGAPRSAALQNEQLRIANVLLPNNATTSPALEFIAPTPNGALQAWSDTRLQTPAATWTWADYNIYGNVFGSVTQGGINVTGKSVLPLTNRANAYPLSGTAFMYLYSCYDSTGAKANRAADLTAFLTWYFNNSNANLTRLVQNNGFNPIPATYVNTLTNKYLTVTSADQIAAGGAPGTNCAGVTGAL